MFPRNLSLRRLRDFTLAAWLGGLFSSALIAAPDTDPPDLSEYRTVATAVKMQIAPERAGAEGLSGYLGVALSQDAAGRLVVGQVAPDSPAARAGVAKQDALLEIAGRKVARVEDARSQLQAAAPGDVVKLLVQRGAQTLELSATLAATSRPMRLSAQRGVIGARLGVGTEADGIPILGVSVAKPAAKAGLKTGDLLLKADNRDLGQELQLADVLAERKPGDHVRLLVRRGRDEFERDVELAEDENSAYASPGERRLLNPWKKDLFRLAVIGIEFSDTKHSGKIAVSDWEAAFFSKGQYTTTSVTGQPVFGSVADYYSENSVGRLRFEGKVFGWVQAPKNRADYNVGTATRGKSDFLGAAVTALLAREGAEALRDFDGIAFIYAGEKYGPANRGSVLWPHRAAFKFQGRIWPYVIVPEAGARGAMNNISTLCHELGHILGLPDLYARPENPGSEGAGAWCVMSSQVRNGRPQHFSAWSKEQLGWLHPAIIDPAVPQKLILGPVEGSADECFKVLVRPDGSEYFLLENRRRKGFDASLPAEGLLIWRVVANRPILEESHGVPGPVGPRVFLGAVAYPSRANDAFTPYTMPSSRAQLGGGAAVMITNIRQLADGRIAFQIGYDYE